MMIGWKIKEFKTREKMQEFINKNKNNIQYSEVFINNAYGIEYKKLLKI